MKKLAVRVLTARHTLFDGEAERVVVVTVGGQRTLLPDHARLLTLLGYGSLWLESEEGRKGICVMGGSLECQQDRVLILADRALHIEDIDVARAEQEEAAARVRLNQLSSIDHPDHQVQTARLKRARARIEAARESAA